MTAACSSVGKVSPHCHYGEAIVRGAPRLKVERSVPSVFDFGSGGGPALPSEPSKCASGEPIIALYTFAPSHFRTF